MNKATLKFTKKETEKMYADREFWHEACEILDVSLYAWNDRIDASVMHKGSNHTWELKGIVAEKLIELNRKLKDL